MNRYFKQSKKQTGLILVVVLMIIPIMFLLSYTSISKLTFGEKVTTNVVERNYAFNAAEIAIADADAWMRSNREPFVHDFSTNVFEADGGDHKGLFSGVNDITMDQALATGNVISLGTYLKENVDESTEAAEIGSGNRAFNEYILFRIQNQITEVPSDSGGNSNASSTSILSELSNPPVFIIQLREAIPCVEPMEKTNALFKVTARGWGRLDTTTVTLETFFTLTFNCNTAPGHTQAP